MLHSKENLAGPTIFNLEADAFFGDDPEIQVG
jgi:hypothetical protein